MGGPSLGRNRKRRFRGNQHTSAKKNAHVSGFSTISESKLQNSNDLLTHDVDEEIMTGYRIMDMEILISIFAILCCPSCYETKLYLVEDSKFGLCSNFSLRCGNCPFAKGFATSKKINKCSEVNSRFIYAMRLIGRGFTAGKKICATMNFPSFLSKLAFRQQEKKILVAATSVAKRCMNMAASDLKSSENPGNVDECGVSVDGTWQRRGYTSLNGIITAISIVTGKVLDIEIMSQLCRICNKLNKSQQSSNQVKSHSCANHKGSSGNMEVVGAYRIFERSVRFYSLKYTTYYGDGDSKGYDGVKDIYGNNSVTKLECIGHIQKRVGTHLRKLKSTTKGLGGKGKLTDNFINKLQNYYGIAIRANTGDVLKMQSATIASFAHCCSSKDKPMHGQCPKGEDSWCKYQRTLASGKTLKDTSKGLPQNIIKVVKPVYMKLCDQKLLSKCLHGKTQNANESFNGVLWTLVPKNVFVELQTLQLGSFLAVIQFNDGFCGLLKIIEELGFSPGKFTILGYSTIDKERIVDAKRHSLPATKLSRKKSRASKKKKIATLENVEGVSYKSGEFHT